MMLVTFMVLPFLAARPVLAQDTLKLDLGKALEIALSENPTVKVADKEIQKKKYARKGSYASLFPQISFAGDYNRTLKKQVMECLQKTLEGRNIFVCSFTSKAMISKLIPSWNTPSLTPRVNKSIHLLPILALFISIFCWAFGYFFKSS